MLPTSPSSSWTAPERWAVLIASSYYHSPGERPRRICGRARRFVSIRSSFPTGFEGTGQCFVTLENKGRLRGCIGNMVANGPFYEAVIRNAVSACKDGRFVRNPVTAAELEHLDIEISYLTPMKRVHDVEKIIIGRHGLMITLGFRRGVLLPQVAGRRGWTREGVLGADVPQSGSTARRLETTRRRIILFRGGGLRRNGVGRRADSRTRLIVSVEASVAGAIGGLSRQCGSRWHDIGDWF